MKCRLMPLALLVLFCASLVAVPMASADDEEDVVLQYQSAVHLPHKNVLYLIEYSGSPFRCYATRTYHDVDGNGGAGTEGTFTCNGTMPVGGQAQLISLGKFEKDTLYTVMIPKYGDVCQLMRTEQGGGDVDVDLTCYFAS